MQHLTTTNVILLFLGLAFHLLEAMQKQKEKDKQFLIGFYLKDNWILMLMNIVAAFALLISADDMLKFLHVSAEDGSPFYSLHALVSGIMPLFLLGKVRRLFRPKTEALPPTQ